MDSASDSHRRQHRRAVLLLPLGALAVHQLRYQLAFGATAGHELHAQGHAYLVALTMPLLALAGCALGALLARAVRAWTQPDRPLGSVPTLARVWCSATIALIAIYTTQELLEGAFEHGHTAGLAGVLGGGGWLALPAAVAVGLLIALLLKCGHRLVALVGATSRARRRTARAHATPQLPARPQRPLLPRRAPLAGAAAGRAPPALPA